MMVKRPNEIRRMKKVKIISLRQLKASKFLKKLSKRPQTNSINQSSIMRQK